MWAKEENKRRINKNKEDNKEKREYFILFLVASLLFLFFVLPFFHNWANSIVIKLHFCNHFACMIYSLVWLALVVISLYSLFQNKGNEQKNSTLQNRENSRANKVIIISVIILIVGIILMNLISCDETGKMKFTFPHVKFIEGGNNHDGNGEKDGPSKYPEVKGLPNRDEDISYVNEATKCNGNFIYTNRTCEEFARLNGYEHWSEHVEGYSNCWNRAVNFCGTTPAAIEDSIDPTRIGNEGEHVRCGTCCVWNCYEENFSCEEYANSLGYDWVILSEGKTCEYIVEEKCDEGVENFLLKTGDCCVWKCKIPPTSCTDNDGDLFWAEGGACGPIDCNDNNPEINPGSFENCDGVDNNCDGILLENENEHSTGVENCNDGFDNDCDGLIDCDDPVCECCQDSDNGLNAGVPGTCNDGADHTDYCSDSNNLMEWHCVNSICQKELWQCNKLCEETPEGGMCT
ncbi:hypothetical protein B6U80_01000 [Candidatus Pacearchaeota archaeon ex4484_26]|nr:MAG: hypothetical protein B6U80_01000 [Candidatus Pacearchaeota archaeon ex4484_26]